MSAFAARQQLWRAATNRVNADAEPAAENAPRAGSSKRPSTEQSEERKTPRAAESEQGGSGYVVVQQLTDFLTKLMLIRGQHHHTAA